MENFVLLNATLVAVWDNTVQRQQDQQVHEGVGGGRLCKDGEVKSSQVIEASSNRVIELAV
jgi:hypothetical protein